ncbi:MAG: hypothetical protein WC332_00930 [Clostridia bacterium]|jgi:hypothetical protein
MIKKYNLDSSLVNYIDNLGMGVEARGALGGTVYYVENNSGNDAWDGLSIDRAFKTLAKAISVSNLDMARRARWARRNTIYLWSDYTTESLVAFPNKCDVVGCGSYDGNTQPGILGHHVPVNDDNYGTRFLNLWLKSTGAAAPIITLASSSSGFQIGRSTLTTNGTTTIGIQATASPFLKVFSNRFEGAFATSYMTFGTGEAGGTEIVGNTMVDAAASGIVAGSGMTSSWGSVIKDNLISAAGITINDAASLFYTSGNKLMSAATVTGIATPLEALVVNEARAADNWLTAANVAGPHPLVDTTT